MLKKLIIGASAICALNCGDLSAQEYQAADIIKLPMPMAMKKIENAKANYRPGIIDIDEKFLEVPIAYRRTALLKSDVKTMGWGKENVVLKSGALGYWVGQYTSQLTTTQYGVTTYGAKNIIDIWCFFGLNAKDKTEYRCANIGEGGTTIDYQYRPPYYIDESFTGGSSANIVGKLEIEEKDVEITPNLKFDYKLAKIKKNYIEVKVFVGEKAVNESIAYFDVNTGIGVYDTPIGELKFKVSESKNNIEIYKIEENKPTKEANQGIKTQDKVALALDFAAKLEKQSNEIEKAEPTNFNFIDKPQILTKPIKLEKYALIGEQTVKPEKTYIQKTSPFNRPDRFGAAGAPLFSAKILLPTKDNNGNRVNASRELLCWRDFAKALKNENATGIVWKEANAHCLEDNDKDGKYEKIWKIANFGSNSYYNLTGLGAPVELDGRDGNNPIEVELASNENLPPEKIGIFYQGPTGQEVGGDGKIATSRVSFYIRYTTFSKSNSTEIAPLLRYSISVDDKGNASYEKGNKKIEITKIESDGSAEILFNNYYDIGIQPLEDYKKQAQDMRDLAQQIRKSVENNKIQ